jgi:hypothetical protein
VLTATTVCLSTLPPLLLLLLLRMQVSQLEESEGSRGGGGAVSVEQADSFAAVGCGWEHNTALGFRALGGAVEVQNIERVEVLKCDFIHNSAGLEVSRNADSRQYQGGCLYAFICMSAPVQQVRKFCNGALSDASVCIRI